MYIKLTDAERLILSNQYEILAHIKKDEHYALLAETLRDGYELLYQEHFTKLSEVLSPEKVEHVMTILGIYGDMRDSFANLSDKSGIEEQLLVFPGFDGTNEIELLGFTQALLKHGGRFELTIGSTAKNSHMPTTDMYERMISKWKELGNPCYPYSKEQILSILEAQIHPDNR
jgi:uncharacterized protein YfbU (UPF0304 family)